MDSKECHRTVDYVVFESCQARNERHVKRLIVIIGILIGLLFITNALWLWFYSGFEFETYEADVDAGNGNANYNYVGNDMDGDVNYGTDTGKSAQNVKGGS